MAHHITQRGNNCQNVFSTDDDRRLYLTLLKENARRFERSMIAYCVMRDHDRVFARDRVAARLRSAQNTFQNLGDLSSTQRRGKRRDRKSRVFISAPSAPPRWFLVAG